jgi:hypothetical protein
VKLTRLRDFEAAGLLELLPGEQDGRSSGRLFQRGRQASVTFPIS